MLYKGYTTVPGISLLLRKWVGGGVRIHPENAHTSGRHRAQYVAQCVACVALTLVCLAINYQFLPEGWDLDELHADGRGLGREREREGE